MGIHTDPNLPTAPALPSESSGDGLPRYTIARGDSGMVIHTPAEATLSDIEVTVIAARRAWLRKGQDGRRERTPGYVQGARLQVQVLVELGDGLAVLHANGYAADDLRRLLDQVGDGSRRIYTYVAHIRGGDGRQVGSGGKTSVYYPPVLVGYEDAPPELIVAVADELRSGRPEAWVRAWDQPSSWTQR